MITGDDVELVDTACWYANALGIADEDFILDIRFYEKGEANPGSGWIEYNDRDAAIYLTRDLQPTEDIMEILAHEMVHLKQYLREELQNCCLIGHVIWMGEIVPIETDPRKWEYWNSPWEREAFGRQQGLNYIRAYERSKDVNVFS